MTARTLRAAGLAATLTLAGCAGRLDVPPPDVAGADTVALARRLAIVRLAHATVAESFAHWEAVPALDLDTLAARYEAEARASAARDAFDLATRRFFGALRNGHTWFDDAWARRVPLPAGFSASSIGGAWVVTRSAVPGLAVGDTLAAFDGLAIDSLFRDRRALLFASDDRAAAGSLFNLSLLPPRFTLGLASGREVAVDRATLPVPAPAALEVTGRWLVPDSVAYLRVPSFGEPRFEARALELLRERASASALVVDVRGNGGGNTPMALLRALLDRPAPWWQEASTLRTNPPTLRPKPRAPDEHGHRGQPLRLADVDTIRPEGVFRGRLVVLTDRACASACEDFVMPLKASGRATVVGERTMGTTGQPVLRDLGDGMRFAVGAKRAYFPDGASFEGVGIAPHVEVPYSAADLVARRDAQLAAALAVVRGR